MSGIEAILKDLRLDAETMLRGTVEELKREGAATKELVDSLLAGGDLSGARLSIEELFSKIDRTMQKLGARFEASVLLAVRQRAKDHVKEKIGGVLREKAIGILGRSLGGPAGGLLAGLLGGLVDDLFTSRKERINWIDLKALETAANADELAVVLAAATIAKDFHDRNLDDPAALGAFGTASRPVRHELVVKILKAEDLDTDTKLEVFAFLHQWHFLTPGQRNLLQDLVRKLAQRDHRLGSPNESPVAAARALEAVVKGKAAPVEVAPAEDQLATKILQRLASDLVAGIEARHPAAWQEWYPRPSHDRQRLDCDPRDLLKPARQALFDQIVEAQ